MAAVLPCIYMLMLADTFTNYSSDVVVYGATAVSTFIFLIHDFPFKTRTSQAGCMSAIAASRSGARNVTIYLV